MSWSLAVLPDCQRVSFAKLSWACECTAPCRFGSVGRECLSLLSPDLGVGWSGPALRPILRLCATSHRALHVYKYVRIKNTQLGTPCPLGADSRSPKSQRAIDPVLEAGNGKYSRAECVNVHITVCMCLVGRWLRSVLTLVRSRCTKCEYGGPFGILMSKLICHSAHVLVQACTAPPRGRHLSHGTCRRTGHFGSGIRCRRACACPPVRC